MDQSLSSRRGHVSVLSCFPPSVGRNIAVAVVKPLRHCVGNPIRCSLLQNDKQVRWTMEVLSYGLTLPLDGETVRLCVDVYTDWLMALVSPRDSIPPPIRREPNLYIQKILEHLYSLFLLRSDQVSPAYPSLCQQVLYAVLSLARESAVMSRDTWEALLRFLLSINHIMLAPPTAAGGVSQLSMAVLLEVWLLSCARCFPSCSQWQTCTQALSTWRHQTAVVEQWSRVLTALTSRLLLLTFGPSFPQFRVPDQDAHLIPVDLEDGRIPEMWFRFLHMFSNPVDLTRSSQELMSREDGQLPNIFFRAMRGVSTVVDAFLGVTVVNKQATEQLLSNTGIARPRSGSAPPTPVNVPSMSILSTSPPPLLNSQLKHVNISKATSKSMVSSSHLHWKSSIHPPILTPPLSSSARPVPSPLRCNVDSILHLFGSWLFDAALVNQSDTSDWWESGRAEACGTLCRIFTCKKTSEDILPVYLSRFYLVLLQSLQTRGEPCLPVLASILLNSSFLFCCDMTGVNLLLPSFISALENVLLDRELLRFRGFVSPVDLRRASIQILLSLLPLPLQFGSVPSEVLPDRLLSGDNVTAGSVPSLKPRLLTVLIGALQTETNASNTQMILGAMLNLVQDSAVVQAAEYAQKEKEFGPVGSSRCRWTNETSATIHTTRDPVQSDAAGVLWIQVVRLVSQHLVQSKNEPAVCLSALEVLGGLAKVQVRVQDSERRRVISSVCSCIVFQCSRPPPLHSRDLHSVIVAAFYCLNIWLTQHPVVLSHQDCLREVLEIVELGLSGSKSRCEKDVRCKEEKELNPVSLRVKEAAEVTLSCVMQVSGRFSFTGSSLSEEALTGFCGGDAGDLKKFQYFVVHSSVILALLEQPPEPEHVSSPSLMVLTRGPSGCRTWSLQLHMQPREDRTQAKRTLIPEPRAVTQEESGRRCRFDCQLFLENFERVPSVKADLSIPALIQMVPEEMQQQLENLRTVLNRQQLFETAPQLNSYAVHPPCRPLSPVSHFQTARLFLSHLGLLTPETLKDPGTSGVLAQLVSLDLSLPGFFEDMRYLDQLSSRICDSALIFYMRGGQRTLADILMNVESSCSVSSHFLDLLSSLGWPAVVGRHQGGGVSSSSSGFTAVLGDSGGGVFNGEKFVLKFTDALMETTFIVPSSHKFNWLKTEEEAGVSAESRTNATSLSINFKVLIIWVERFEDIGCFPLSELLSEAQSLTRASDIQLLFIHPLKTGLYRICYRGNSTSKFSKVVPLVDGSVVSKRCLGRFPSAALREGVVYGFLLRETVINCCRRGRLESDSAPPPHARRKHVISDIILRYHSRCSEPSFYSGLFHNCYRC